MVLGKWLQSVVIVLLIFANRTNFCTEVYAAREKVGVYIPKERYYQEESERKVFYFLSLPF